MKTISPTPNTSINKLTLTAAYYLSFIMLGLLAAIEGPALPSLAKNTSSTLDLISLIFIFGSLGYLFGSLFSGRAYDRLPGHRLMSATMLLIALCAGLVPLTQKLWQLLLILFVLGLGKGCLDVGGNTLILWVHGKKSGPFMNGLHFFFGVGAFVAPLILAGNLASTGGIQQTYWLFTLLSLPLSIWLWMLPEPPARTAAQENKETPLPIIPVALIVLAFILYVGAEFGFGNWVYTYAITLGLGTTITSAYLTSAFWGTFTLGRLIGIWVSTRARPFTILFVDLAGCLLSLSLILLWPDSVPILWIAIIGLGLFMASVFPTTMMLAGERMNVSGAMTGWFLAGASLGGMFLPWGIGQAFAGFGAGAMPIIVAVAVAFNLLIIILFNTSSFKATPVNS
jgi:FHS family Na+ dependent glucose MFS transporter 1